MSTATLLASYLDQIDGAQPFDWRRNNCAHFAGGWWRAATGADPLQGLHMPTSAIDARHWLAQRGSSLPDLVARFLGRSRINPALAGVGDLVIVSAPAAGGVSGALGICTGRLAVMLSDSGRLVRGPMSSALHAYRLASPCEAPA